MTTAPIGPEQFIQAIHGDALAEGGRLVIFGEGSRIKWCRSPEEAAQAAQVFDAHGNVYMSCCLLDAAAEAPGKRGSIENAVALGALWADIDVGTDGHSDKKTYPPTLDEALKHLRRRIEQPPSIIVETGGGAHLWWLLDEPMFFETEADRTEATDLVKRWQLRIREAWQEKGWVLDATADLARVMRLPGTHNHKHTPARPVRVTHWDVS